MAKKKSDLDLFIEILLAAGLFYLLYKYITRDIVGKNYQDVPGIHGPPKRVYSRKLIPINDKLKRDLIVLDLLKLPGEHVGAVIRAIMKFRESPTLIMPLYKRFKESTITGEIRYKNWRLFTYQLDNGDHLFISFYQKKDNETKKQEIDRAERRLAEYLSSRRI